MEERIKLLEDEVSARESDLRLAAEFGQLLVRENGSLKETNVSLAQDISELTSEIMLVKASAKRAEESSAKQSKEMLRLETQNHMLSEKVADLEDSLQMQCHNSCGQSPNTSSSADSFGTSQGDIEARASSLEEMSKTSRNLQRTLDNERKVCNALKVELSTVKSKLSTATDRSMQLERRNKQLVRENEDLGTKLENMIVQKKESQNVDLVVEQLARSNEQYKEELDEALELLHVERQKNIPILQDADDIESKEEGDVKSPSLEKNRTSIERDPMVFHFHMVVQSVKVHLEKVLGCVPEFGSQHELSTEQLYKRVINESVPFYEYFSYVLNAYRNAIEQRMHLSVDSSMAVQEAARLLHQGHISVAEFDAIVRADRQFMKADVTSPMPTEKMEGPFVTTIQL